MIATLTSIETSSDAKASDSFSCATPMPRLNIVASDENVQHMATAVQSPNIAESALSEVAKLATTIKEIRAMNRKIHGDLYVFDQAGFDHRQGKLSVEWQTYMTNFEKAIDVSRSNATAASAFVKDYKDAVMVDVSPDEIDDIKVELQDFTRRLDDEIAREPTDQERFDKLVTDVDLFRTKISLVITDVSDPIRCELEATEKSLDDLKSRLEDLSKEIATTSEEITSSLAVGAGAATRLIHTLAPDAMVELLSSVLSAAQGGFSVVSLKIQKRSLESDVSAAKKKLADIGARSENFKRYEKNLLQTQDDITALVKKLEAIANIWLHIRRDMQELKSHLDHVAGPDSPKTKRFFKKLTATRQIYQRLADLLDGYAHGVETSLAA